MKSLLPECLFPALGVGPEAIATIDDDIPLFEKGNKLINNRIDGCSCLDHDHSLAWTGQRSDELFESLGRMDPFSLGATFGEFLSHSQSPVVNTDGETFAFHIEDQILAHHGEADQADITLGITHNYLKFRLSERRENTISKERLLAIAISPGYSHSE